MKDLPLLELFTKLRSAGLPLGVDDYQAVLRSLQGGYGLTDRVALARVCRMLWVRSADEQQLFDYYFQQMLGDSKPEITDETEILKILQTVRVTNRWGSAIGRELAWRITSSSFRALCYALIVSGTILGSGMVLYGEKSRLSSFLDLSTIVGLATPDQSPNSSPSNSPQPSTKPLRIQDFTPEQTARFEAWKKRSLLETKASQFLWFIAGGAIFISFITGLLWVWRAFQKRSPKPRSPLEEIANSRSTPAAQPKIAPQVLRDLNDEVAIVQAVQQTAPGGRSYATAQDYLPVTQRQLKQSWRYLRQLVREGVATELDIEATTQQIARCGMLLEPVVVPPRQNRTELLLLVDQDGSMVAFRSLAERLTETAARGGRLGKMGIFYFRNCPIGSLYRDPLHLDAEPVEDILAQLRRDRTVVLIFSDGGAARGGFSRDRVDVTAEFLAKLQPQVRRVVWLNPMPQSRWAGTTAAEIARSVPMFEATRLGIEGAIGTLRGRYHGKTARGGDQLL
jgi:uncharacterized protein